MSLHKEIAFKDGLCAPFAALISAAATGKIDVRDLTPCAQA